MLNEGRSNVARDTFTPLENGSKFVRSGRQRLVGVASIPQFCFTNALSLIIVRVLGSSFCSFGDFGETFMYEIQNGGKTMAVLTQIRMCNRFFLNW